MAQEIKMVYGTVKQGLSQLKNSAALKSSLPGHLSGRNHLNVVNSIEQLNKDIKELTEAYASVLAQAYRTNGKRGKRHEGNGRKHIIFHEIKRGRTRD